MAAGVAQSGLRRSLALRLAAARRETDALFDLVRPEALLERPIRERHRILFYLGHLEAFDWNLIGRDCLGRDALVPEHDRLFAFGIDPVDGGLPTDVASDWPPPAEVRAYAQRARAALDAALSGVDWSRPGSPYLEDGWAVTIAIEHRLAHAETLAYMLHQLGHAAKASGPPPPAPAQARPGRVVEIPGGVATLGLQRSRAATLGWDNEYEAHAVDVPAFAIDSRNVSCGEFLEFVEAGGYQERSLWDDAAWLWLAATGRRHPGFWARRGSRWFYRGMFAEAPLSPAAPVYVSHAEATAYARWRGRALPTEAQFHRAAYAAPDGRERPYPWGDAAPRPGHHGAFGFTQWDPAPVGSHPAGDSGFGVSDLVGNGWEWTRTPFAPFAGFEPLPFYRGYSADFFDGDHFVMKGASPRTDSSLLRRSFRNWFQPRYPWVYASFRCVEPRE